MDETSGQRRSPRVMDVDAKRDAERTADICLFLKPFSLICIHVIATVISISTEINQHADTVCCNETSSPTSESLVSLGEIRRLTA